MVYRKQREVIHITTCCFIVGGLETEADYSYKGEDEKCVFKKKDVKVYINDSVSISSDEGGNTFHILMSTSVAK
jgi:hypothetical protein